jgi:hypothetical protein
MPDDTTTNARAHRWSVDDWFAWVDARRAERRGNVAPVNLDAFYELLRDYRFVCHVAVKLANEITLGDPDDPETLNRRLADLLASESEETP